MSVTSGSQLGPYVVGERFASGGSGEWFDASEAALERPVSVLVTALPAEEVTRSALRERAQRLASVSDARLLPVYGQGEDDDLLWFATRKMTGHLLTQIGALDIKRAARLGSQVARQLAALEEAGLAPDEVAADDVFVEESGENERAWLLPTPMRAVADDASSATQSLVKLLEERIGRPLVRDPSSDPQTLSAQLTPLLAERSRRGLLIGALVGVVAAAVLAAVLAVTLTRDTTSSDAASSAPIARTVARIPLGATISALTAGEREVWAATPDGALIHVDTTTDSVVGAPVKQFPEDAYLDLVSDEDSVWAGGPGLLLRLDASTGRVLERKRLGDRAVSGLLVASNGSLWATLNDGPSPPARLVRFDSGKDREVAFSPPFGVFPTPVTADAENVWALGGDASFTRVRSQRASTTIGVGVQAGFPTEHEGRVWIPTRVDRTIVVVDPARMTIEAALHVDAEPVRVAAGAGSIWVLTENPSLIYRIDPATMRFLGSPLPAPVSATFVRFGAGSLWVDDPKTKTLIRLAPTEPPPTARPAEAVGRALRNGPVPVGVRMRVTALDPHFSIRAAEEGWLAEALTGGAAQFELIRSRRPGLNYVGASIAVTKQVFDRTGRLVPVRTPEDFLRALRKNPQLRIGRVAPVTLGGRRGLRVLFETVPKPPFPEFCRGAPCVLLFPQNRGTFVLLPGNEEFTIVRRGPSLFLVDASLGDSVDRERSRQIHRLVDSIRFEP